MEETVKLLLVVTAISLLLILLSLLSLVRSSSETPGELLETTNPVKSIIGDY